jgi:hypothetical protein
MFLPYDINVNSTPRQRNIKTRHQGTSGIVTPFSAEKTMLLGKVRGRHPGCHFHFPDKFGFY